MSDPSERIRITPEEVAAAVPPPPAIRRVPEIPPPREPAPPRTSALAIASFTIAVAGVPLVGCLLGPIAVLAGALALAQIQNRSDRKGVRLAVLGIVLGVVELGAWIALLFWLLGRPGPASVPRPPNAPEAGWSARPSPLDLGATPEPIRSALVANVRVETRSVQGSGVLIADDPVSVLILTNRHVAAASGEANASVDVAFSNAEHGAGHVIWLAPDGVDAAVVEAGPLREALRPIALRRAGDVAIGESLFAIGNPLGYEATYTAGPLSSVRTVSMGTHVLRVYQTQCPVNPGNSGGGLYAKDGRLLGINTWATEKRVSEGLGFAIAIDSILDLMREAPVPRFADILPKEGHR